MISVRDMENNFNRHQEFKRNLIKLEGGTNKRVPKLNGRMNHLPPIDSDTSTISTRHRNGRGSRGKLSKSYDVSRSKIYIKGADTARQSVDYIPPQINEEEEESN
jgi:hypothetical protein